jgi:hypothetical protein
MIKSRLGSFFLRLTDQRERFALCFSMILAAISVAYAVTTVIGISRQYSGIPYWDSWDGNLDSILRINQGDFSEWWSPHNEHRILLARLLFWFDAYVFGGSEIFLLVSIFAVVLFIAFTLVISLTQILKQTFGTFKPTVAVIAFASLVLAYCTSWMQRENLVWGFQTQFVLVVALPLATFVLLGYSAWLRQRGLRRPSAWALALAGLSASGAVLSMSAGLATPWLALVGLVALKFSWRISSAWAFGSLALTVLYFVGYSRSEVSILNVLATEPFQVAQFFLRFIGAPAFHVSGSTWLGTLAGLVVLALTLSLVVSTYRNRASTPSAFTLSLFALYVLAFGFLTAAGRVPFGVDTAFSSRYATPAIALWLVLGVLLWVKLHGLFLRYPIRIIGVAAIVILIPASLQGPAVLGDTSQFHSNRNLAAVALSLDVADPDAVRYVYPDPARAVELTQQIRALGITSLGRPPFSSMRSTLGQVAPEQPEVSCQTSIDLFEPSVSQEFARIAGTSRVVAGAKQSSLAQIIDGQNQIVGFVSLGTSDTFAARNGLVPAVGFEIVSGYVVPSATGPLRLSGSNWTCIRSDSWNIN